MKSIKTLIKLQQRQLDTKRRYLKELQDERDVLAAKKVELEVSLIEEQNRALENMELAMTLPAFVKITRRNIVILQENVELADRNILKVRDEIAEIFQVLKRYEIYKDFKQEEADQKLAQREQKLMDEMGLRGFIYKEPE